MKTSNSIYECTHCSASIKSTKTKIDQEELSNLIKRHNKENHI